MDLISNPIEYKCQYADFIIEYLINDLINKELIEENRNGFIEVIKS